MAKRTRIISPHVTEPPPGRWSTCLKIGDTVYVSGLTARGPAGVDGADMYAQSKAIFAKMKHLVEAAGGVMNDVVKLTIFVTDVTRNTEVWKARQEFFTGDFPTSTLVEISALAAPELLVEIEAVAIVGSSA